MLGWAPDSLGYRIRKAERKWRATNTVSRKDAYGPIWRQFVELSAHPKRWVILYTTLLLVLSASTWLCWNVYPKCLVFGYLSQPFLKTGQGLSVRLAYVTVIWTIQATLTALVYPIVISFVTILLQRRYNAKVALYIYLADSAAIPSGLGALVLVGIIGVQYLIVPLVPPAVIPLWGVLDGGAFLFNLWLMATFIYHTFEFIRPDKRADVMGRYATNIAWPVELRKHLMEPVLATAIDEITTIAARQSGGQCTLAYDRLGQKRGVQLMKLQRAKDGQGLDVRIRLLRWSIALWTAQVKNGARTVGRCQNGGNFNERLVLSAVRRPGPELSGLVVYEDGCDSVLPSKLAQKILRHAFVFTASESEARKMTVSSILADLQAEVRLALQSEEEETFRERLSELTEMYRRLVKASIGNRNDTARGGYSFIADSSSAGSVFFDVPVHQVWGRILTETFNASTSTIEKGTTAVKEVFEKAHVVAFELLKETTDIEMVKYALSIPVSVFYGAQTWWQAKVEQQGDVQHGVCHPTALHPPLSANYTDSLMSFVSQWELLKRYGFLPSEKVYLSWEELQNAAPAFEYHLQNTAVMLLVSVYRGDRDGAILAADMLQKWFGPLQERGEDLYFMPGRATWTLDMMKLPWPEVRDKAAVTVIGNVDESKVVRLPEVVFWAIIKNYWVDVCYTTTAGLLHLGEGCDCDGSLVVRLVRALLLGEQLESGDERFIDKSFGQPNRLFFSIWRRHYGEGNALTRYTGRLANIVSEAIERTEAQKIHGRVYTSWAFESLESWRDGLLVIMTWLVSKGGIPSLAYDAQFRQWVQNRGIPAEGLVSRLRELQVRLEKEDFRHFRDKYACLFAPGTIDTSRTTEALETIIKAADEIKRAVIADAPVDSRRIEEIAGWASDADIFGGNPRVWPLSLFGSVMQQAMRETNTVDGEGRSVVLARYPKSMLIMQDVETRPSNERQWFAEMIREHVLAALFKVVVDRLTPSEASADSPDVYWAQLQGFAAKCARSGRQPVLFVGNPAFPDWLLKWIYSPAYPDMPKPSGFAFSRDPQFNTGGKREWYLGSFGAVPAFHVPQIGRESFLVARESLKAVTFLRGPTGHFVEVAWEPDPKDALFVNLKLSWRVKVEVEAHPALRLMYD